MAEEEEALLAIKINPYTSIEHRINKLLADITDPKNNLEPEKKK